MSVGNVTIASNEVSQLDRLLDVLADPQVAKNKLADLAEATRKHEEALKAADAAQAAAQKTIDEAEAKLKELAVAGDRLAAATRALNEREVDHAGQVKRTRDDLTQRAMELSAQASNLAKRETELQSKQADFNERSADRIGALNVREAGLRDRELKLVNGEKALRIAQADIERRLQKIREAAE